MLLSQNPCFNIPILLDLTISTILQFSPLSSASIPSTLETHIQYSNGIHSNHQITTLHNLLTTTNQLSTNISLSLKISESGCLISYSPYALPFQPRDRYPPLKSLKLDGYDFSDYAGARAEMVRRANTGIRAWGKYLAYRYLPRWLRPSYRPLEIEFDEGSNLCLWKEAMDWSHLERLELRRVDLTTFLQEMNAGLLPSLKDVALWRRHKDTPAELVEKFLLELEKPLERLFLHGFTGVVDLERILRFHGPTLRALELREGVEYSYERIGDGMEVLDMAGLRVVDRLCPYLTNLSIDVNGDGDGSDGLLSLGDTFDTIVSFENLRYLALDLDFGINLHNDQWKNGIFNTTAASELFNTLRKKKMGVGLESLVITVGGWGWDFDMNRMESKWICDAHTGAGEGEDDCRQVSWGRRREMEMTQTEIDQWNKQVAG